MQAACQCAYPSSFSMVVSVASEALSASGMPWQEGAKYSLSVCPLFLRPMLLIQAGDILTHQEGRCHLSEASCALLDVVQPRVFLEPMVWHPVSQALVTFAQVHMDRALPQAWALVLPGSRVDRETLFPPPSCLPTPHPHFLGWFVDPVTSRGGGLSLFPLYSYFPTKLFAHKLFSQALLFRESRLRDQWKHPLYAWSLLSAQDWSWNEGMENTYPRLPAFTGPPAPCAACMLCPRSVRVSLLCRLRPGQIPPLCFILPG